MDLFYSVSVPVTLRAPAGTTGSDASFDIVPVLAALGHHKLPKDVYVVGNPNGATVSYSDGRVSISFATPVNGITITLTALLEY